MVPLGVWHKTQPELMFLHKTFCLFAVEGSEESFYLCQFLCLCRARVEMSRKK